MQKTIAFSWISAVKTVNLAEYIIDILNGNGLNGPAHEEVADDMSFTFSHWFNPTGWKRHLQ